MKLSNLPKLLGTGALAASLTVLPVIQPAQAQLQDPVDPEFGTPQERVIVEDDGWDWGWLGLIGLLGLAGLAGRKKGRDTNETVYTEPTTRETTTNYPDYRR